MKTFILVLFFLLTFSVPSFSVEISEIASLREIADSLHSIGRTDSAAIVGERAVKLARESGDSTQIVGANASLGVFLRSLGKIDEALKHYDEALAVVTSSSFREHPDQEAIEEIAVLYINLAVLNLDIQHKDQAAKQAELAGEWVGKCTDPEIRSGVYGVVGSVLTGCGLPERALHFQALSYADALESGDTEGAFRAAAYNMLSNDRLGNRTEAARWRTECQMLMDSVQSTIARLVYFQAECSINLKNGDDRGALEWFDRILHLEGINSMPFVVFDCYNNMHLAYANLGDYKNAYEVILESNELRDSLWAQDKAESLRDLTVRYETKETELALVRSEARRANTLMWLFAVMTMLVLAVAAFVIYAGRQRRRRMLKEIEFAKLRADIGQRLTRQYVEGLENERRRMARELHDGVCNDLLAIRMNINNGSSAERTARLLDACRDAVRRISHELMPPEFAYANLDEVLRFFVSKQAETNVGRIAITYISRATDADWGAVPDSTSLEIYRIIQEALSNAVKHSGATEIAVNIHLTADTITAEVIDNGIYKETARGGIGLESIRQRSNSIKGDVVIQKNPDLGTIVSLTVKNYGNP